MKNILYKYINKFKKNNASHREIKIVTVDGNDLPPNKTFEFIQEIENVYKELVFKDYPTGNKLRAYLVSRLLGTGLSEAIYIINYLFKSMPSEGDVCEFGVAQGRTSALLANEIQETSKDIWLFDSFQGLPKPSTKDILKEDIFNLGTIEKYEGTMSCEVQLVKNELKEIGFPEARAKIIPGFIETTIKSCKKLPKKVCFAYVDFDFYEPILTALNYLDATLQRNGFIIVDDYDFFSTGAKTAVDEFMDAHRSRYHFSLPIRSAGKFCILEKTA